jgi:hypothetical protein
MFLGETKKERELMFKKDTRKGLALGAAFSLIVSMFAAAPAAQAGETGVVVTPMAGTSYTMLITEEFVLKTRLGTSVESSKINNLKYYVEKPAGTSVELSTTVSSIIGASAYSSAAENASTNSAVTTATDSYEVPVSPSTTNINQLRVKPYTTSGLTSVSAAVDVKVTAFLDIDPDGKLDKATEPFETVTIKFVPWSALGATVALDTPIKDATSVDATAAVSGVNFEQLNGEFNIVLTNTHDSGESTASADLKSFAAAGAMSTSADVDAAAAVDSSVSATLYYDVDNGNNYTGGEVLAISKKGVAVATIEDVTVSSVAGDNLRFTAHNAADSRVNSEFTLKAWAYTGSTVVAAKVPTFTVTTSTDVLSATNYIVVNGVTYTQSSKIAGKELALTAGTDGKGTITISTFGFDGTTDTITVAVASDNDDSTFTVTQKTITYTVSRTAGDYLVTTPGATVTADFAVKDQFGVASNMSDQQVSFAVAGTGFSSSTLVVPVAAGKATAVVTPTPATATGSYTITPNLQYKNRSGQWVDETANEAAVTVYVQSTVVNSFSTKPRATVSASISYGVAFSWSDAITANVAVTGSDVVVSATGVIFQYDSKTYSDKVTIAAGTSGAVSFKATSAKAGKYTLSFVAGTATASTVLTVQAAAYDSGKTLTFDKTSIAAGATSTITGTLVDANGNPVETGSTGSIVVKWTGLGLPFNLPASVDTDADGKFSFQVLALNTEIGEAAISATYQPNGAAVDTKNLTFVVKVLVGEAKAELNTVIGSFNGRWAVRVENAKGSAVVIKVGGNWYKVTATSDSFVFSRKSRVGATPLVKVWVDGALENEQTVTVK